MDHYFASVDRRFILPRSNLLQLDWGTDVKLKNVQQSLDHCLIFKMQPQSTKYVYKMRFAKRYKM